MRSIVTSRHEVALALAFALVVGCAAGPNPLAQHAAAGHAPAGFLLGLWHGVIVWVTFFVSLFDHDVSVYEVHNSGVTYNLGFVLGVACAHGGGARAAQRKKTTVAVSTRVEVAGDLSSP